MVYDLISVLMYLNKHTSGFHVDNVRSIVRHDLLTHIDEEYSTVYAIECSCGRMVYVLLSNGRMHVLQSYTDPSRIIRRMIIEHHLTVKNIMTIFNVDEAFIQSTLESK